MNQTEMCWRLSQNVVAEQLGEEMVLVHLKTDRIYRLNPTGARTWQLLESGLSLTQALTRLQAEFDVDPDQLRREINELLMHMQTTGLVENDDRR